MLSACGIAIMVVTHECVTQVKHLIVHRFCSGMQMTVELYQCVSNHPCGKAVKQMLQLLLFLVKSAFYP